MDNFLKNKKLVIICIIAFLGIVIFTFFMMKDNSKEDNFLNAESKSTADLNDKGQNETKDDSEDDGFIYIHILGEVKNQGFLKLLERK